ncbi:DUF6382 domain-containing protein [Paenibacillus sp. FSL M8-0334]|uniref:DUF6382 domain-containing protein n=1 Tax=Paenibacillus sp. FSL M8-0334 TaxID=2921623 RepID=UPI0030F5526C
MLGLNTDFVQNGGTFMVLGREQGIAPSELNPVQLGMIRSARIPHLLKLHVRELDNQVTLEYDISGKKMLSQALKSERLSLTEYYGLLLQIATALNEARQYMLQPEQYVLHEDYIFVEGDLHLGTLYLCYVPLENARGTGPGVQHPLKEFMTRLLANVTELKGGGVQALMSFCASEAFHLTGLKELLIDLLSTEDDTGGREARTENADMRSVYELASEQAASEVEHGYRAARYEPDAIPTAQHPEQETNRKSQVRSRSIRRNARRAQEEEDQAQEQREIRERLPKASAFSLSASFSSSEDETTEEEAQGASPVRTYIVLGCMLAAAVTWRFLYMNQPGTLMLIVSAVITLLLAAAAWLAWQGKLKRLFARSEAWTDSGSLPLLESVELPSPRKIGWGIPKFEADPLSEVLTEHRDIPSRPVRGRQRHEEELTENWRWNQPDMEPGEQPSVSTNDRTGSPDSGFGGGYNSSGGIQAEGGALQQRPHQQRTSGNPGMSTRQMEEPTDAEDYYRQLSHKTSVLASGDAGTMLLSAQDGGCMTAATAPRAFIETTDPNTGASQRIELVQQHFIIGRSPEVAQYVASAPGTSRAHVELSRDQGGYLIKDLGSKNGTVLNGEPMVPYKGYALQEGDTFVIAGGKFSFRVSV